MKFTEYEVDAVLACADLAARAGAKDFEIGYLDENVPVDKARWYAQASFRGARLIADEKTSPDEAADGLARRLLAGASCTNCFQKVTLAGQSGCRWHRDGAAWVRGCDGKRQATKS